jgi:hypothetical protein
VIVCGRKWDENNHLEKQYRSSDDECAGHWVLTCLIPMLFRCHLCRNLFQHWLCADKVWLTLPKDLRKKTLCVSCCTAARQMARMFKLPLG